MDTGETGNIRYKTLDETKFQRKSKMQSRMYNPLAQTKWTQDTKINVRKTTNIEYTRHKTHDQNK